VTKSRTTVTVVLTAGPGDAPFVAGENRPVARVSVWEEILEQREKNWGEGSSWGFIRCQEGASSRRRGRRDRQRRGEARHGVVLSTMRDEEMRTTLTLF
jgi:hypothetical protein